MNKQKHTKKWRRRYHSLPLAYIPPGGGLGQTPGINLPALPSVDPAAVANTLRNFTLRSFQVSNADTFAQLNTAGAIGIATAGGKGDVPKAPDFSGGGK